MIMAPFFVVYGFWIGGMLTDRSGIVKPARIRHCERSEAIQSLDKPPWIASSLRSSQ
jgi:hypothetical protein